jgi:hypothetical protein
MLRKTFTMLRKRVFNVANRRPCNIQREKFASMLRVCVWHVASSRVCNIRCFGKSAQGRTGSLPPPARGSRGGWGHGAQTFDPLTVRSGYGAYPPGNRVPPIGWSLLRPPWSHCWTHCWKVIFRSGDDVHRYTPRFVEWLPWGCYDNCAQHRGSSAPGIVSWAGWIRPHPRIHLPPSMFAARKVFAMLVGEDTHVLRDVGILATFATCFGSYCCNFWCCKVFASSKHFCMSLATRDWPCCDIIFCRCVIGICCPGLQQARAATARLHPTTRCQCLRRHPRSRLGPPPPYNVVTQKKEQVEDVGGARNNI